MVELPPTPMTSNHLADKQAGGDPLANARTSLADRVHSEVTAWVVLAVSLCITAFSWWFASDYVAERAQERFDFEVQKARQAISKRMQEYEQVLRGGVGLFVSSDSVTRQDWFRYVDNLRLDTYWPGLQGIGHALMIKPVDLPKHTESVRREGFSDYEVHPAGPRPIYSSIVYLEPFAGRNLRAFGFDMYSEPVRRAAMMRARDSGRPALSGRVTLMQEDGKDVQAGFLMYLPLYRTGLPLNTVEQRQAAHYGYIYSAFRARDLMNGILGSGTPEVDFTLYDGEGTRPENLLYAATDSYAQSPKGTMPRFTSIKTIELAGHTWTALFHSSVEFDRNVDNAQPLIIGIAGLVVDVLLFAIIWSLSLRRRQAAKAAHTMAGLLDKLRLSASVFQHAREGIFITDANAHILDANQMFSEVTGYSREEALGKKPNILSSGRHDRAFYEALWKSLITTGYWSGEICNRRKDASLFIEAINISAVRDDVGRTTHYVALFTDITAQKQHQEQIEFMAQHDVLTQLPNRALLFDRLEVALSQTRRSGKELAVAYLDLDGFKPINDALGHAAGDEALIEVARRLKTCVRAGDTVARLGGDEFALVLSELAPGEGATTLERVRQVLALPYAVGGREMRMSASIGYTLFPADKDKPKDKPNDNPDANSNVNSNATPESLLRHADQAMYQAKESGRDRVYLYALPNATAA